MLLYLLGLSYGAVSLTLEALGVYLCKSRVYDTVQAVAKRVPGLKRKEVFADVRTPVLGCDVTSVKCNGRWLPLGLSVAALTGLVLSVDELSGDVQPVSLRMDCHCGPAYGNAPGIVTLDDLD